VDVAEQDKSGAVGESQAVRDKEIRVAENMASSVKGQKSAEADRRVFVHQQEAQAVMGENLAKANIADYNAELASKQAAALQKGEVAKRQAEVEIQKAQYLAETQRLNAVEVAQREIDKRKIEISADAEAEKIRREAKGQADAILFKYTAEAEGIRKVLESKAAGYRALVESCAGDAKSAATLLMIEKLDQIVAKQVEAIKNLKIDKITVWDSGSQGGGSSTAGFVSNLIKSLPPLHEIAKMAGVELPDYLGHVAPEKPPKPEVPFVKTHS
jgi:flotillin